MRGIDGGVCREGKDIVGIPLRPFLVSSFLFSIYSVKAGMLIVYSSLESLLLLRSPYTPKTKIRLYERETQVIDGKTFTWKTNVRSRNSQNRLTLSVTRIVN